MNLEDDEVKELLRCLDKSYFPDYRDYIAIMLMLDSGTRLGETLSIEINKLKEKAIRNKANALIGIDFETSTFRNNMIGVMVMGTAVIIEKNSINA